MTEESVRPQSRQEAFEEFLKVHGQEVHSFCRRLTGNETEAEELSQEGYLKAFQALASFNGQSSLKTWIYSILVNCDRDRLRRRHGQISLGERAEDLTTGASIEGGTVGDLQEALEGSLGRLPPRQREVLELHLCQSMSYEEIAEALGVTYADVKVNLCMARKRLRELLKEYLQ